MTTGFGPDAAVDEAAIRADERARIRSLLPYHIPCCENFLASVGDLVNEHGDAGMDTASLPNRPTEG